VRVFRTKSFSRFAKKARITDEDLCRAVEDAERGLIDADLGGGVIKQRIARRGGGKSGGFRTIVLYRSATRSIFVYGFAKNQMDNIRADDLVAFRELAIELLGYDDVEIQDSVAGGTLVELRYDGQAIS
jgi:hypothetical protein